MEIVIGINEAGQRLDKFCRKWLKDTPLSSIYKAIRKGDIKVNGKKSKEKYFVQEGDIVKAQYITVNKSNNKTDNKAKAKSKFIRIDNHLKITYEDENMLLVEKWPGVLVHANRRGGDPTLTDYVLSYLYDKGDYTPELEVTFTPASCNRLDRNTSGVVIFGKNYEALKSLNEMIRERKVKKYYSTLVKGRIKDGIYEAYISKNEDANISKIYDSPKANTKKIAMDVKTIQTCGSFSFLEIELITGRSHQLRAHLSHLNNPIIGDYKYGDKKLNSYFQNKYGLSYQYLYAYKLVFRDCPEALLYMKNKTIAETLPPIFKKIKKDIFKF